MRFLLLPLLLLGLAGCVQTGEPTAPVATAPGAIVTAPPAVVPAAPGTTVITR